MAQRNETADSFDEFFGASKTVNDGSEKKMKQNHAPTKSAIATLIKSQPVVHHRRTPTETNATVNSKKMPLTTNIKNPPATDFDENASADEKKGHRALPLSKQRSSNTPHGFFTAPDRNVHRKVLPHIRSKNQTKRLQKEPILSEVKQRVLSAQNQKLNQLQSRLNELSRQLENELTENKTLRTIQKRDEKTLRRYEDQEYDIHKVARDYTHDIADVKEKILNERENKIKFEQEIEDRDVELRKQTKRIKFYEKIIGEEPELDESDQLQEKLKETERKLKKYQDKISNKEKQIETLEKKYREEIHQELLKQRKIKDELRDQAKKYTDLQNRLEEKTRQLGTMHIYIQRGGRRPSSCSMSLLRARSLQSLEDSSPRLREKILEYDKKRREEERLKPKPKPKPVSNDPSPKPARKKYVPSVVIKPKRKPTKPPPPPEKPPIIEDPKVSLRSLFETSSASFLESLPAKDRIPIRPLSAPKDIHEDKSDTEEETIIESVRTKPKPTPTPTKTFQRSEDYITEAPVRKRSPSPVSPSPEPKFNFSSKPPATREDDDKWSDMFDTKAKEDSTKDDLLSKLISNEQEERKPIVTSKPSPPSSQRPSMIMFEPSSMLTNGNQKKTPARITTSIYDFDQTVINLHEGKPVTAQPTTTRTSIDPFETLFDKDTTKSTHQMDGRDDTFTTTQDSSDPFDSLFSHPATTANSSTTFKPNPRPIPTQNDKLQRPKIVNNAPRPIPNRTVVEEIEEFVL